MKQNKTDLMLEVTGKLREQGIEFDQPNPWMVRFTGIKPMMDYWPTTGKCMVVGGREAKHCSYHNVIRNVKWRMQ